jgi:hypothetical protein
MVLKLCGVVTWSNDKKILMGGHIPSIIKLKKYVDTNIKFVEHHEPGQEPVQGAAKPSISHPLTNSRKFYVNHDAVLPEIQGEKVIVWVNVCKYQFTSNATHNLGQQIRGWNLRLVRIEKNPDW